MCIIRSFLNKIEYIIVWVKEYMFEWCFVKVLQIVNLYFIQFNFIVVILK